MTAEEEESDEEEEDDDVEEGEEESDSEDSGMSWYSCYCQCDTLIIWLRCHKDSISTIKKILYNVYSFS